MALAAISCVIVGGCGKQSLVRGTVATSEAPHARVDDIVRRTISRLGLPSVAIVVIINGRIAIEQRYEGTGYDDPQRQTRYEIGSVTKQFTAACILLLQQDGKLRLDDKVRKYFPFLKDADQVTLRELLTHTAGYPDYYATLSNRALLKDTTLDAILHDYATTNLDFRPGTRWAYSNTGYAILAKIIEKTSGMPYAQLVDSRIFKPLQMTSAIYEVRPSFGAQTVVGYERVLLGPLRPAVPEGRNCLNGAAGLAMTSHDLALWDLALLHRKILSAASEKAMFTAQRLTSGASTGYGLGVYLTRVGGLMIISHEGSVSGFTAESAIIPQRNFSVIVLCNEGNTVAPTVIAEEIAAAYGFFPSNIVNGNAPNDPAALREAEQLMAQLRAGVLQRSSLMPDEAAVATPARLDRLGTVLRLMGKAVGYRGATRFQRGEVTIVSATVLFSDEKAIALTFARTKDGKLADLSLGLR